MRKKTNFEQVPLEVVQKVVEEQVKQEETSETGRGGQERRVGPAPTTPLDSQHAQPPRKEGVTIC
jgi:hypothetical protein